MIGYIYLGLCILGTVLPLSQFVPFVREHGLNLSIMIHELFANRISSFFGLDVIVSSIVFWLFVATEGRRQGMKHLGIYILCNLTIGLSLGLPLFLFSRERAISKKAGDSVTTRSKTKAVNPASENDPSEASLKAELGKAKKHWDDLISSLRSKHGDLAEEWRASKSSFGSICLIRNKKRTLIYLTPESEAFLAAVVLGERAVALALKSNLPERIKKLIREARPYAEGRGIRFEVKSGADVRIAEDLVAIKTT